MSEKTIRVCDRCESDGEGDELSVETLTMDVMGQPHELDVCAGHKSEWDRLQATLAGFKAASHPVGPPQKSRRRSASAADREENAKIRAWARGRGMDIGDRGRIGDELRAEYWAAQRTDVGHGSVPVGS